MWTQFWDMYSGGGSKEKWDKIYIEAPEDEAKVIFYNRFGHNPERVSCTCCGEDYSITESDTLEQATAYHRNCAYCRKSKQYVEYQDPKNTWSKYMTLQEYLDSGKDCVIYAKDIKPEERVGDVPKQGYVWQD